MGNIASSQALLDRTEAPAPPAPTADEAIDLTAFDSIEILSEIRKITLVGDCPVCYSPQNAPGGCLCQRAHHQRVEWIRPACERIRRVAKEKAPWLVKFAVVVALVGLVALKMMSGAAPMEADEAGRTEAVRSALKDVASAQTVAFKQTGTYSTNPMELRHHGARTPSDITVRVVSADAQGYCLEATSFGVDQAWRYSSYRGTVEPGHC
jgi:hypothetical protein